MRHQTTTQPQEYLPYIDGLRALAVLSVIAYHLNHYWLPGGFSGVDVFFVISGFVVSASMDRQGITNLISFATRFYARRIRRIVPALVVCLLFFSLLSVLFIPNSWLSDTNEKTGFYAFFGLSNLVLTQTNNDYFSPKTDFNPYTHTWSLGVEEQFYFVFPLLFFLWVFNKDKCNRSIFLFLTLAILSLICAWWFAKKDTAFAYYMIFTRFWELAAGVILYQFSTQFPNGFPALGQSWKKLGTAVSLGLIITGFIFAHPQDFPFPWALFPVLGTVGLLFFLRYRDEGLILNSLSHPYLVFVGRISYSLYLWHWPIIVLFRWTVGVESAFEYLMIVLLTFLFATGSYYIVELPFRYAKPLRLLPDLGVVFIGITTLTMSFATSYMISQHQAQWSLSVVTQEKSLWYPGASQWEVDKTDCLSESGLWQQSLPKCSQKKLRLFAVGDSHTGAYYSMLQHLSAETGIELFVYTRGGCSYISFFTPHNTVTADCQQFYRATEEDIKNRAQPGDILFLSSLRLMRFGDQWALFPEGTVEDAMFSSEPRKKRALAVEEAIDLLKSFKAKGMRIVFEAPKPIFRAPPFRCSDWFNKTNPICLLGRLETSRSDLMKYREPVMDSFDEISQAIGGIDVWDPFPILCPDVVCQTFVDGKPLFFDGDHISGYGNQVVYGDFVRFLAKHIDNPIAPAIDDETGQSTALKNADPTVLITHYYLSILGREPDPEGLGYWQGLINAKKAQATSVKPVLRDMADTLFNSSEYLQKNTTDADFTNSLYRAFFQREPDKAGLNFWVNRLTNGMTRTRAINEFLYASEYNKLMRKMGF